LFDFALARLDREEIELEARGQSIVTIAERIREAVDRLLARTADDVGELLGAGVSLPGQVDPARGVDVFAPNWGWHDVPVLDALRAAIPAPVRIDNALMALATGELWFGAGRRYRDFLAVNLGTGVGAGVIVDGQMLRGVGHSAGTAGSARAAAPAASRRMSGSRASVPPWPSWRRSTSCSRCAIIASSSSG